MRLFRFLLVFIGVTVLVVGSIFWINRESFITVFQNRAAIMEGSEWVEKTYSLGGVIEFMAEQPDHAALFSTILTDGDNTADSRTIRFHSDRMYPAGNLSNLFLVITYAEKVTSGELHPDDPVSPEQIASFHIHGMDRQYRRQFENWINEQGLTPGIGSLVRYVIRSNDPAAADYLYFYLGEQQVKQRVSQWGKGEIEPPFPRFGLRMMALDNKPKPDALSAQIDYLSRMPRRELINRAEETARHQWNEPREIAKDRIPLFQDERALYGLYPGVTPERFAEVLIDIHQNRLVDPETSRKIKKILQKPAGDRLLEPHVTGYAAMFDERMGFISGWSMAETGENKDLMVQVILLQDLPAGLWFHMNSNFIIQDYHHRMFYDPAVRERTHELLNPDVSTGRTVHQ